MQVSTQPLRATSAHSSRKRTLAECPRSERLLPRPDADGEDRVHPQERPGLLRRQPGGELDLGQPECLAGHAVRPVAPGPCRQRRGGFPSLWGGSWGGEAVVEGYGWLAGDPLRIEGGGAQSPSRNGKRMAGVAKVAAQCGIEIGCPQSRCVKAPRCRTARVRPLSKDAWATACHI